MKYIAVDLENNQPSGRIIQIGAVACDTEDPALITSEFVVFVDPDERINWDHSLNNGQTLGELLGDQFQIKHPKHARSRKEALDLFWQWVTNSHCGRRIFHWGGKDITTVLRESKETGVAVPGHLVVVDLKTVYRTLYQPALRLPKRSSLESACGEFEVAFSGRAHDALVDATATGSLVHKMYRMLSTHGKLIKILKE